MAKKMSVQAVALLQLGVGLFLVTLGIAGITHYNSDLSELGRAVTRLFGRRNDPTSLVVAVIELVAGVFVVGALVVPTTNNRVLSFLTLIVAALWLVYLVVFAVRTAFEPDLVTWLNTVSADLVVLMALWLVNRRYS